MKNLRLLLFILPLAACSRERHWESGQYHFEKGVYPKAIRNFERYLSKAPSEKIPAVHLALGRCYSKLSQFDSAAEHFERAAQISPFQPEAETARQEMLAMEDYLPLKAGMRWEEVDADTKGRNMYALNIAESHPGMFLIRRKIYAGIKSTKLVREVLLFYSKEPGVLWERAGDPNSSKPTLLLAYPYKQGADWVTWREGRQVRRSITRDRFSMETAAGKFGPCIEIAEAAEPAVGSQARIYDTYCLGTGRVQAAIGDEEKKSVFSELLSFKAN